jgi:hypothetical protein
MLAFRLSRSRTASGIALSTASPALPIEAIAPNLGEPLA